MAPKKKPRQEPTSRPPEEVPHDPFRPRHPPDEHECDQLIVKRPIAVERIILIAGFEEHGVAELLNFYKLKPFLQLTQECYPTPVRAFYSNIRNVEEEKYTFHSSFKGVSVRVSPLLIAQTFGLETPKKSIDFGISDVDIKAMGETITKELCGHSIDLATKLDRTSLLPKYRILSLILLHTVLNKKGHFNDLTLFVVHILFNMARRRKINFPALICHNIIEARRTNVSTRALPYGSTICLLLKNAGLKFEALPYESMPRMQPMRMKNSMEKENGASSSRRASKTSQLGDIYAMCKAMNKQLKLVRQQCDRSVAAWKALHPNVVPPTPPDTDNEEVSDGEDEDEGSNGDE